MFLMVTRNDYFSVYKSDYFENTVFVSIKVNSKLKFKKSFFHAEKTVDIRHRHKRYCNTSKLAWSIPIDTNESLTLDSWLVHIRV